MSDPRQGKRSASGIESLWLCPGKANAERGLAELEPDDVQRSGVKIHDALAGKREPQSLDSDELSTFEHMRDEAARLAALHGFKPEKFHPERRLWFENEFSGEPDRVYIEGVRALCVDFKSGWLPVTKAAENPQLACLGVLTIHNYGVARVTVAIIPRFGRVKEVAEYDLTSAGLALGFIRQIIADAEKPDAPRKAGDKQCKYCRFSPRCPEYRQFAMAVVRAEGVELPTLPSSDLAKLIERIPAVLNLCERLTDEGKRRLAAGDEEFSKHYELTKGRSTRTITNIAELYNRCKAIGISDTDFTRQCDIPFGVAGENGVGFGLNQLVHNATKLNGKALKEKVKELLSGVIEEGRTAGSLKKRDAS